MGVLTGVSFTVALGFGIVAPILPQFAAEFGVGVTAASAVISAFAFMRFVSALGGGRLVDRLGERAMLATGIAIVAISSALAGLSTTYVQLLVLRGIGGVGSALFSVSAMNLLLRVVGPELRGRATGAFQSGFIIGGVAGPTLGGIIAAASVRAPFFVYAGMLAVAGSIGVIFLRRTSGVRHDEPEGPGTGRAGHSEGGADRPGNGEAGSAQGTPRDGHPAAEERVTLGGALGNSAYRTALAANLGNGWVFFGVRSALIPLFVVEALHRGPVWTGIGFGIVSGVQAVTLMVAGRVTDTRGRRPAMMAGAALALASMLMLAVPSSSLILFLLSMVVLGAGASLLGVAPGAVVGDVAGGRSGTVVAFYQMSRDFGVIVGPLVAGMLAENLSYAAAFGASAAIMAAVAVLAVTSTESRHAAR